MWEVQKFYLTSNRLEFLNLDSVPFPVFSTGVSKYFCMCVLVLESWTNVQERQSGTEGSIYTITYKIIWYWIRIRFINYFNSFSYGKLLICTWYIDVYLKIIITTYQYTKLLTKRNRTRRNFPSNTKMSERSHPSLTSWSNLIVKIRS